MEPSLLQDILQRLCTVVFDHAEELTALDRAIGDGDHGLNMKRGFEHVLPQIAAIAPKPLGLALQDGGEQVPPPDLQLAVVLAGAPAAGAAHGAPVEGHLGEVAQHDALAAEAADLALLEEHHGAVGDEHQRFVRAVVHVHGIEALENADGGALVMPLAPELHLVVAGYARHRVVSRTAWHSTDTDGRVPNVSFKPTSQCVADATVWNSLTDENSLSIPIRLSRHMEGRL